MKPKTDIVMADIIQQIKDTFPFDMSEEEMCADTCAYGCPRNLLEYMHAEITEWEQRLENGETPNFRDIQKLSKTGRKIYRVLEKNDLVGRDGGAKGKT
jgi:hypothetical protein